MNRKAFIFTMDATLALIPVFILLSGISIIGGINPTGSLRMVRPGRIAHDVLTTLETNGTLVNVSTIYQTGVARNDNTLQTNAINWLNSSLNLLVPSHLGYNATVATPRGTFTVSRGTLSSEEDVISVSGTAIGPELGWAGIAWYQVEQTNFTDVNRTMTSTLWNFHNWLSNFYSVCNDWGPSGATIGFSAPQNATIHNAYYMLGAGSSNADPFDARFYVNGGQAAETIHPGGYTYLYTRTTGMEMYNANVTVPVNTSPVSGAVGPGDNTMRLDFFSGCSNSNDNMPWFALIANYTNPVPTPENLVVKTFSLPNAEGFAVRQSHGYDMDSDSIDEYGMYLDIYDDDSDSDTTDYVYIEGAAREIDWYDSSSSWESEISSINASDGRPFAISQGGGDGLYGSSSGGSTISVVGQYDIPSSVTVVDATLDLSLYGGVDAARIEAYNVGSDSWTTIFNSFNLSGVDYSDRNDGYGNIPGKIDINTTFITPGATNKVRVTFWDYVPSSDWDWVGIIDSTITVSYTSAILRWNNYPLDSHQDSDSDYSDSRSFEISSGAQEALLFVGIGTDSTRLRVDLQNSTSGWVQVYDSTTIPYMINLAEYDITSSAGVITTSTSNVSSYTLKDGTYSIRVRVNGPSNNWKSGDWDSNAEIFSGTKVTILYPEFIDLINAINYNATASDAEDAARVDLSNQLADINITIPWNSSEISAEAIWVSGSSQPTYYTLKVWLEG